jgi:Domain of unknown function (DU1801)
VGELPMGAAMAYVKTKKNDASVTAYLKAIEDRRKRADAKKVATMMRKATGAVPRMWGSSIVGYGKYRYRYESGREGEWMITGFSARKHSLVVYIMPGFRAFMALMKRLGDYKTGKSCLYIKTLDDVDTRVLQTIIERSVKLMRKRYETE